MSGSNATKPRIGITLGDINGIGPEVAMRAILDERVRGVCEPVVVGPMDVCVQSAELIGSAVKVGTIDRPDDVFDFDIACWAPPTIGKAVVASGEVTAEAGQLAHDCLRAAARACRDGSFDAICTAPLNKAALSAADIDFPGHTEILADEFGVDDFAMMLHLSAEALAGLRNLIGPPVDGQHGLAIAHVTLHTSIESVPGSLSSSAIKEKIGLVHRFLSQLEIEQPKVAVCALNPHGGEGGLFGDEESTIIEPAIGAARELGIDASGPFPTDTLIRRAILGEFSGVVAMYHDQGHIPVKLVGFDQAVNVTLGIPIVRTSPTHGTAFDIAWQGRADANGMVEALLLATRLADRR